jgi:hypothetical protein
MKFLTHDYMPFFDSFHCDIYLCLKVDNFLILLKHIFEPLCIESINIAFYGEIMHKSIALFVDFNESLVL